MAGAVACVVSYLCSSRSEGFSGVSPSGAGFNPRSPSVRWETKIGPQDPIGNGVRALRNPELSIGTPGWVY